MKDITTEINTEQNITKNAELENYTLKIYKKNETIKI